MATLAAWYAFPRLRPGQHTDFGQSWFAARAVLAHQDPYSLIGPGRPFAWASPYFFPLPASLVVLPLAPLSEAAGFTVFVFISAFAFAWAVTKWGYGGLWAFTSFAVLNCLVLGQWSLALTASVVLAPFAMLLAAKPTIGAALFMARPRRSAVVGGIVLVALSFLVQPGWFNSWRSALGAAHLGRGQAFPHVAPVAFPGGVLVLLALSRWRRMEARLLVAMACVPQSVLPYEAVPLFLIPQTTRQMVTLAALSYIPMILVDPSSLPNGAARVDAFSRVITVALYLPATMMVLRRPNVET